MAAPPETDLDLNALWQAFAVWLEGHTKLIVFSLVLGALIVALLFCLKLFGQWLCRPARREGHWPAIIGRALSLTRLWFMAAVAAKVIGVFAHPPDEIGQIIKLVFTVAATLQAAIWVRALILGIVEHRAAEADPAGNLGSAVGLIRLFVTAALFLLAVILILANLGVDVTGLIAGLGIGGIAIGLAAQGIFSDLFAALTILFDKPFRKGDLVRWDTTSGTVEYIGLKSSRIRAISGEEIIVSNANLLSKELRNFARLEGRRVNQLLSIVYHTPTELCERMSGILEEAINACEACSFQRCGLTSFAPSSLDFELIYDIAAESPADVMARRNEANMAIMRAFETHGIAFAYPTQTTYTAAPDGKLVMPYAPPSDGKIVKR
jgi:small-conductance mechanosensitive channel